MTGIRTFPLVMLKVHTRELAAESMSGLEALTIFGKLSIAAPVNTSSEFECGDFPNNIRQAVILSNLVNPASIVPKPQRQEALSMPKKWCSDC